MSNHNQRLSRLHLALVACGLLLAAPALAGTVVVAHPGVAQDAIASGDLQGMFLGKTSSWSDGATVKPAVLADGPVLEDFLKTHVKKSASQFKTFWKKAVFSGTGTPPAEFATEVELIAYVAATPGAVGFVSEGAETGGAKVLTVQ